MPLTPRQVAKIVAPVYREQGYYPATLDFECVTLEKVLEEHIRDLLQDMEEAPEKLTSTESMRIKVEWDEDMQVHDVYLLVGEI